MRDENAVIAGLWNRNGLAERLDYERYVALLMRYNQTRHLKLLFRFDGWARRWLQRHADTDVAVSRLMIARAVMPSRYPALCQKLHLRYPDEPRLACPALNKENSAGWSNVPE